jgi:hypothetical protein
MVYGRQQFVIRAVSKCNPGISIVKEIYPTEGEARGYAIELENAGESCVIVNASNGDEVYRSIDLR